MRLEEDYMGHLDLNDPDGVDQQVNHITTQGDPNNIQAAVAAAWLDAFFANEKK